MPITRRNLLGFFAALLPCGSSLAGMRFLELGPEEPTLTPEQERDVERLMAGFSEVTPTYEEMMELQTIASIELEAFHRFMDENGGRVASCDELMATLREQDVTAGMTAHVDESVSSVMADCPRL